MKIEDWLLVILEVIFVIALVIVAAFGNKHFKNKRAEKYREIAVYAAKQWVGFMDRQDLSNEEKFDGALNNVVKELTSHGYDVGKQRTNDLKALIEWTVTRLRMEQAQTGVNNTVKHEPEIKEGVDPKDIVQPTQAGVDNGK